MKRRFSYPVFRQPRAVTFGSGCRKDIAHDVDVETTVTFLSASTTVRDLLERAWGSDSPLLEASRVCIKAPGEPTRESVQAGAAFLRERRPRTILGIGGGSVMDWCRLAWAESVDLLGDTEVGAISIDRLATPPPEFWLVPTTHATGAEAAAVAVLLSDGRKVPVVADAFLATRAFLDGHFLRGLGRRALADSAGDTLSHAIESFLSIIQSPFADDAAIGALERIFNAGDSDHAEDRLMEAGFLGGVAASNASVGLAHAFAHSVARFGVPHGRANAFALPAALKANASASRMALLLDRLRLRDVDQLIARVQSATAAAITPEDRAFASRLRSDESKSIIEAMKSDVCLRTNPVRLSEEDLAHFLEQVATTIESA